MHGDGSRNRSWVDVGHPLLEQVRTALRTRVRGSTEPRTPGSAYWLRTTTPSSGCVSRNLLTAGADAFVGAGRRHPDVGDDDVRGVLLRPRRSAESKSSARADQLDLVLRAPAGGPRPHGRGSCPPPTQADGCRSVSRRARAERVLTPPGAGGRSGRRRGAGERRRSRSFRGGRSTTPRTMARPRPLPPSRRRASSNRVKRSKTCERSATGMPGPSSSTVSTTSSSRACRPMVMREPPWRSAFSTRLRTRRASSLGSPGRRTAWTAPQVHRDGDLAGGTDDDFQVDLDDRPERGLVQAGQLQQVGDERLHAGIRFQHTRSHRRPVGRGGIPQRYLDRRADRRERASSTRARRPRRTPLLFGGRFEPVEHVVIVRASRSTSSSDPGSERGDAWCCG